MAKVKPAIVPAPSQSEWEDVDSSEWEDVTPESKPTEMPESSALGAAGRGFTDVTTLGYMPQLVGGANKLASFFAPKYTEDIGLRPDIREKGQPLTPYIIGRDEYNKQIEADTQQQRLAQLLGKGAGLAASMRMPLGPLKSSMPGWKGAAETGARMGAVYGGLSNPGDTEGQLNPVQADKRVEGAFGGALTGSALGAAGGKLADWFRGSSQRQAVRSLNASPDAEAELQIMGAGKTLQEQGLMKNPFQSPAELQEKIARSLPKHVQAQQSMLAEAERRGATVDISKLAEEAQAGLKTPAFASQEASMAPVLQDIESTVAMSGNPSAMPVQRAQDIKAGFQSKGFETAPSAIKTGDTFTSNAYKAAQAPYREAVEQAVAQSGAGDIASVNQTLQHLYSVQNAMKSGGISANQAAAQLLRNPIGSVLRMLRTPALRAAIEPKLAGALEKAVSSQGQATMHRAANTGRGGK